MFLGFVDAGAKTAHYNLKKNNSLYILIGGEREQLLSSSWTQKVYIKNRKGFVKLALQYGAHLVPVVSFPLKSNNPFQYFLPFLYFSLVLLW